MKKIFLTGVSILAVLATSFAFSAISKAATNPSVELTNSQNTWSVEEGSDITLYFRIMPRELKNSSGIGFNGYENGTFTEYCYGSEDVCGNYTIKNLKAGTYRLVYSLHNRNTAWAEQTKTLTVRSKRQTPTTTPNLTSLKPTLTVTPNVTRMNTTDSITLRGNVNNAHGVWGMEVRALPSWTNVALKNRCILNNKPTTGSCSLNIGPFAGHAGETVKVWVIYWDAKTGLGYSSEQKILTITGTTDNHTDDLTVAMNAPKTISADERVTFTARTSMDDGAVIRSHVADTIRLYVNNRLVRTCYNVSVCSYVGGPFGHEITHRATRVSYYATATYGNQFDSIPVQYSSIDYTN